MENVTTDTKKTEIDVLVVLLTLNQKEKTLRCLESLNAVEHTNHRIILWDNGSIDGTLESAQALYPDIIIHHHPENAGVATGRNSAVELARRHVDPAYLLFLDNDMIVEPDFLGLLVAPFADEPRLAQSTGKIRDINNPQHLYGAGGCRVRFWLGDTMHNGYGELDAGQYDHIRQCLPSGGCMLVRSDVFDQLGGFSTMYDPYGPEDLDFGLRAVESGYFGMYVPEAIVYHETRPGRTFESGQYTATFATLRIRHWFRFMNRHASSIQKVGFYLVGIPYLLIGFIIRQRKRGSLWVSFKNLLIGIYSYLRKRMNMRA
jgi:GT2 family glycosyltransferase